MDELPITYATGFRPKPKNPYLDSIEWKFICWLAPINGIKLKEPNVSCKHCHGKGYTGYVAGSKMQFDGQEIKIPISCNCIVWDIAEMVTNPMAKWNLNKKARGH